MYKEIKPLFLTCETPLHAGSGSDLGVVDLPIQRERHTSFPKIESSSLKGAFRESVEIEAVVGKGRTDEARNNFFWINRIFGYDEDKVGVFDRKDIQKLFDDRKKKNDENQDSVKSFAGAIGFTDARLLLFPVKSLKGVFAWVTCKKVLLQWLSDMQLAFSKENFTIDGLENIMSNKTFVLDKKAGLFIRDKVVLEEYAFSVDSQKDLESQVEFKFKGVVTQLGDWLSEYLFAADTGQYWKEKIKTDVVILPDDDFKDFVNLSTEVITRTKIDNASGTVASGALFTEEYLPTESVLYSLVMAHDEFTKSNPKLEAKEVIKFFDQQLPEVLQIGGNATIGKGIVRVGKSFLHISKTTENEQK